MRGKSLGHVSVPVDVLLDVIKTKVTPKRGAAVLIPLLSAGTYSALSGAEDVEGAWSATLGGILEAYAVEAYGGAAALQKIRAEVTRLTTRAEARRGKRRHHQEARRDPDAEAAVGLLLLDGVPPPEAAVQEVAAGKAARGKRRDPPYDMEPIISPIGDFDDD